MDTTSSIIAIVDLSFKIIRYMNEVREGDKERSELHKEVLTIYDIFWDLKYEFETRDLDDESSWSKPIKPLFKKDGVIGQLQRALADIASKIVLPQRKTEAITRKLKWPFEASEVQLMINRLRSYRDTVSLALNRANLSVGLDTNNEVRYVRHAIETAELETALNWISPLDFRGLQNASQRRSLPGTGSWFLDSPQVQGWSTCRIPVLWCHGIPGAGKTVLATALLRRLQEEHRGENVAVLIAYCSFDDASTHSSNNILSSFVRQLVETRGKMSQTLRDLFTEHSKARDKGRPSRDQLVDMISKELATFDNTFIIIDGLDELPGDGKKVELLQAIESLQTLPQLMVTSRPIPAIAKWFQKGAKQGRYQIIDLPDGHNQSLYLCDNCESSASIPSDASSKTFLDDADKSYEMVEAKDAGADDEQGGEESESERPEDWKAACSYRCENCARDVCVNCYEQYHICFGCGRSKESFRWAWPSTVTITAHLDDLRKYILWRIEINDNLRALLENARSKVHDMTGQIVTRVQDEAHKMFLLAKFHMNALERQHTAREVMKALETLPSNINGIYDSVFSRIGNSRLASTLENMLIIVATSQRLLSTEALAHAIAVQAGDDDIDELQLSDIGHLAPMCAGLIEIDHVGYVRLAHETIGEYIANSGLIRSKSGNGMLAEICLTYLQFSTFNSGAFVGPDRKRQIEERRRQYPLLSYAATHWGFHAARAHDNLPALLKTDSVRNLTLSFVSNEAQVATAAQFMWLDDLETSSGWDAEEGVHGLHLSAHFNLTDAVSSLLAVGTTVDVEDCLRTTPLMYAAQAGHADMVHILLHSGADASRICARGRTALHRACEGNHISVLKELVASPKDIAVNALDTSAYSLSALMWAVHLERSEMVELLLTRKDIDLELKQPGHLSFNALLMAVSWGELQIAEKLLKDGRSSIEATDSSRRTALTLAAANGFGEMVSLLLNWGADTDARDVYDGPPLLRAVDNNALECVRILVEHGVDCSFKDFHGRGLLHGCAVNARGAVMRHLLKNVEGLDPNAQGDNGETPLHDGVLRQSEAVVRVLLEYGARTDIQDRHGRTPLRLARDEEATRLFDLLRRARMKEIEADEQEARAKKVTMTEFDLFDHPVRRQDTLRVDYKVPIEVAVRRLGKNELEEYLQEYGPKLNDVINDPSLALVHTAAKWGQAENIGLLLKWGADLSVKDEFGFTALHVAVDFSQYEALKYLVDKGCKIDERDLLNRTPLFFATTAFFKPAFSFLLLKHGAKFEPSECDSMLATLIYAVDCNELEVVKILVQGGVPFQVKDAARKTPYQRAKMAGHHDIAQYLYEESRRDRHEAREGVVMAAAAHESAVSHATNQEREEEEVAPKENTEAKAEPKAELEAEPEKRKVSDAGLLPPTPLHGVSVLGGVQSKSNMTKREIGLVAIIFLLLALLFYK